MIKKQARHSDIFFLLFLLALAFALYWPGLQIFFSLDDLQFLSRAAGIDAQPDGFRRILSTRWFFSAAWTLFGTRAWAYHLVVLLLHAANAWILYLVARRLNLKQTAAFAASILFAAAQVAFLPLHWISGIQEVTVTFFALVSAYFFIGKTTLSMVASLAAGCLSLLCKETSFLLLPALALALPAPAKRKWILGSSGLLIGLIVLALSGSLSPRPAGDPYESSFGANILWNLLTYSAWLFQFWKYYPDKTPQVDSQLAGLGLILPILILLAAWRIRKARRPIAKASAIFILTLLPVLPLVRHSYFYYLYLPLIPFWVIAGAYLGNVSRRSVSAGVLAMVVLLSFINGIRHRRAEIADGVPEDPILRYGRGAENAVNSFRASGEIKQGDYLIVMLSPGVTIDASKGLEENIYTRRDRFLLVEKALLDWKALRLFFPAMQNIAFEGEAGCTPGWQNMHFFRTYKVGMMEPLGYGAEGRFALADMSMKRKLFDRARKELSILLESFPDEPTLIFMLGDIARTQGDAQTLSIMIKKLEELAAKGDSTGIAREALNRLKQAR
jgi:hypothetical protein